MRDRRIKLWWSWKKEGDVRSLIISLLICLAPALVFAQGGVVCLYADVAATDCTLDDTSPGLMTIYVLHTGMPSATAVEFSAPMPGCMVGATWLTDSSPMAVAIGNSQIGVSIGYGMCKFDPIHVLTITYATVGTSLPDCAYPVLPHPGQGLNSVDCLANLFPAAGGTSYVNSTLTCDCAPLPPSPVIAVTPGALVFGGVATERTFEISNIGSGVLAWNVTEDQTWLSVSPASGIGTGTVTVTVDRTGLAEGTYNGSVEVTSNGGDKTIPLQMIVPGTTPVLNVTPTSISFGTTSTSENFNIQNVGGGTLTWFTSDNQPWMSITPPDSGVGDATVTVTCDRTGLAGGTYNGSVSVTSNGGNAAVAVEMIVPGPVLQAVPPIMSFGTSIQQMPLVISNAGTGTLSWSVVADSSWIDIVPPTSGTGGADVLVRVNRSGLPPDDYAGVIHVSSNGGSEMILVTMSTRAPVKTHASTWGRIKALYR